MNNEKNVLSSELLEKIAGGLKDKRVHPDHCTKCSSPDITPYSVDTATQTFNEYRCKSCGFIFPVTFG